MRIPDWRLSNNKIRTYGAGGMEFDPGHEEPGCPRLYKSQYVDHNVPPEIDRMALDYGSAVHSALYMAEEDGIDPFEALKAVWPVTLDAGRMDEAFTDLRDLMERGGTLTQLHTVAVEQGLSAPLYEDEEFGPIEYFGIIDNVSVDNDVEIVPRLWAVDYKTDRSPPTKVQVRKWRQGIGYGWLLWKNSDTYLPGVENVAVSAVYDALKWYSLPISYTVAELEVWEAWAISVARTILRDDKGAPRLNPGCSWCPIRSDCPAILALPGEGETMAEKMSSVPLEERVTWLVQAKSTKSKLDSEIKSIEKAVVERIRASGAFVADGKVWTVEQGESRKADVRRLFDIIGEDIWGMLGIRLGDVDKWAKEHLEAAPAVDKAMAKRPSNYQIKTEKVKDE